MTVITSIIVITVTGRKPLRTVTPWHLPKEQEQDLRLPVSPKHLTVAPQLPLLLHIWFTLQHITLPPAPLLSSLR